jgi:subtilase family serine protease
MRKSVFNLAIFIMLSIYGSSASAHSPIITSGFGWLTSEQTPTGNWPEVNVSEYYSTTTALAAVYLLDPANPSYTTGFAWMTDQVVSATDYLSRRIIALKRAGADASAELTGLLLYRNINGGWGGETAYASDALDTTLALQALKAANFSDFSVIYWAADFLMVNQNADGGWGFIPGYESNVFVTAHVLKALAPYNGVACSAQSSMDRAVLYLLSKQNHDNGGFGSSPSNVYETALAIDALVAVKSTATLAMTDGINYLTTTQLPNGSWNDDPYATALALQALANVRPNLSLSSLSLSKPMPRTGEDVTITALVANSGLEDATGVVVRFYSGDPASGGVQIGTGQMITLISRGSSSQAAITTSFAGTGAKTVYAVVDPDNLIAETNENDNKASARLWVATGPDLAVFPEDLKPSTYVPATGTAFTFEYTVRNLGETEAGQFSVALYDGDPATGGAQLQTTALSGIPGGGSRTGTFGVTLSVSGPHTLYLVADSLGETTELSETNNKASATVTVGGTTTGADLAVTPMDITLTPNRPAAGEAVQISARVRNQGTDSAFGFLVEIYDGAPESGGSLIHSRTLSLASGIDQTIIASWTPAAGIHDIQVIVDRENKITETNETNNRTASRLMPDMVDISVSATDLVFTPSRPVANDSVVLTISARNSGIRNTGAFNLGLYNGDPNAGGTLMQNFPIANIAGDGSQSLVYSFTASPQTYRFYAVADTENVVAEMYEENNLAVRSLTIKSFGETYGPDLVPVKIDLSGTTTDPQTLAISGNALVFFQNKGDDKITTSFNVTVFEDRDNDGKYTAGVDTTLGTSAFVTGPTASIPAIWPDGAGMVSVPLSGMVKFLHSPLYALIDSGDAILEQEETNNYLVSCKDCEVVPANPIQPVVKWKWQQPQADYNHGIVQTSPIITYLTDDNLDGLINGQDVPSIVINTSLEHTTGGSSDSMHGKLWAFRGNTGEQLFSQYLLAHPSNAQSYMAGGDINGDGKPELVVASRSSVMSLLAFRHDGTLLWDNSSDIASWNAAHTWNRVYVYETAMPVLADLDGDGNTEIIAGIYVFNGDGSVRCAPDTHYGGGHGEATGFASSTIVADVDMDGKPDIVAGNTVYNNDCTFKWRKQSIPDGVTAVGNLNDDPYPEIVLAIDGNASTSSQLYLLDHSGNIQWGPVYLSSYVTGTPWRPGHPLIADFDGDGNREIGVRTSEKYLIFDHDGILKTSIAIPDTDRNNDPSVAPTVFDLNGDGRPEIITVTGRNFMVFDGKDGSVLFQDRFSPCATAGSCYIQGRYQNVLVADINNDGHVEIVAAGYDISTHDAIRVYGSANNDWVNGRKVWNQPSYHVTNVNDDGTIPQYEAPSWLLNNTYRTQAAIGINPNPYLTPNLTASYLRGVQDSTGIDLTVRIGNGGATAAPMGTTVTFYDGNPATGTIIGTAATTSALASGEYQDLTVKWTGISAGLHTVTAFVDPAAAVAECRKDDNQAALGIDVLGSGALFGPDLAPTSFDIDGSTTDPHTLSVSGVALVTFQNRGDTAVTTAFDIFVFEDRDRDGRYTSGVDNLLGTARNAAALLPNGANMLPVMLAGSVQFLGSPLFAMIDPGDVIREQDEANNVMRSATKCDVHPASTIEPVLKWKWRSGSASCLDDVHTPPVVAYLHDDNGDGKIDAKDTPYVLFITPTDLPPYWTYWCGGSQGILHAVNGKTGQELFRIRDAAHPFSSIANIAVGDINNDGLPEIVVPSEQAALLAFRNDGTLLWDNLGQVRAWTDQGVPYYGYVASNGVPAIADLDADGSPEIVVGRVVFNGNGSVKWGFSDNAHYSRGIWGQTEAADIDLDGKQEIIAGNTVYNHDGSVKWINTTIPDGFTAIGNFDDDQYPEIVFATGGAEANGLGGTRVYLLDHNGNIKWGPVHTRQYEPADPILAFATPPVVADFDGDGEMEIGVRGYAKYFIFDKQGGLKQSLSIPPRTSSDTANATVFDLDGDGRPEVIINSGYYFRIFDGKTGTLLYEQPFGSFYTEYQNVLVADVDADGHAEIVVVGGDSSWNYNAPEAGVNVYRAKNNDWVGARSIWNQPGYHVTNVNDNGSIPRYEAPSWLLNNTYRCQAPSGTAAGPSGTSGGTPLPNLTASLFRAVQDGNAFNMTLRVGNSGVLDAPGGIRVAFYDGDPLSGGTEFGWAETARVLAPGEYQDVAYRWSGVSTGQRQLTAVIDPQGLIGECNKLDNRAQMGVEVTSGLPDLIVTLGNSMPPAADPAEGELVPVTVQVRNMNAAQASNVMVGLYSGNPATGGTVVGSPQTISTLAGGSTATLVFIIDTLGRAGENIFYVAVDPQNTVAESNEDNNVVHFNLSVLRPVHPNLSVVPDSIQISPAAPSEGASLVVSATIMNRGAATGGVPVLVRFSLGGPASSMVSSEQIIYESMNLGQSVTVTASLNTIGAAGEWPVSVTVDPANTILETNEADNTAATSLFIQSAGVAVAVSLDKPEYQQNEIITATVTAANATAGARTMLMTLLVKDSAGSSIATVSQAEPVTIGPFGTAAMSRTWNTGSRLAGGYTMVIELAETGPVIARNSAAFSIAPDKRIEATVTTNKIAYYPNESAELSSVVKSGSANYIFENLTATATILSADGRQTVLQSGTRMITTLMPGAAYTFKTYWNTGIHAPGTYPITLEVRDSAGTVLASGSQNLVISSAVKPSAALKGSISVDKQSIMSNEPVSAAYTVTNAGNVDLTQVALTVRTVHVKNQTVYGTLTETTSLALATSVTTTRQIDTATYTAMDYLVVLQASINNGPEETLAGSYFRIEGAPTVPSLSAPTNGTDVQTLTPVLAVSNASDPNDDKLTYEFELYADSGLTTLITSAGGIAQGTGPSTGSGQGTTSFQVPAELTENSTYHWRSRAFDGKLYGDWMQAASFRVNVANDPPTVPTIASPADNTEVSVLKPVLTVNNASDPDSAGLTYNFQVSLDPGFTQVVASIVGVFSGQGTTSWQVSPVLSENIWYYWRAQADDWLDVGPWMQPAKFFVNTANDKPTIPVILSPVNNAVIPGLNVDIVLQNSTDPDSPIISYNFEVDTVPTFDSPGIIRSGIIPAGPGTTTWKAIGLLDNTPYYLRAMAGDNSAGSGWTEPAITFFVNTANDAPTTPVIANPSNGAGVSTFTPTLTVHDATDLDRDALTYEFEVYSDAGLTNRVSSAAGVVETPSTTSWTVPVVLSENQTYWWRVRAFDGSLNSGWTPAATFTVNTANDAPGAPAIITPLDGGSVDTATPTLKVQNALDPDSDHLTYEFEVYSGTTLVWSTTGITEGAGGNTSVTIPTALSNNTVYQWQSRAYDGDRYGPWTAKATFTVHLPQTGITVDIEFEPETLNKKSNGNWVMVEIELPHGYRTSDVDISSIRLEGIVPAVAWPHELMKKHHDHGCDADHSEHDHGEIKVKFSRSAVIAVLPAGDHVPVHVTGTVAGTPFEGVDIIRVIQ